MLCKCGCGAQAANVRGGVLLILAGTDGRVVDAWRARVSINGKRQHLGYFKSEINARHAIARALKTESDRARTEFAR